MYVIGLVRASGFVGGAGVCKAGFPLIVAQQVCYTLPENPIQIIEALTLGITFRIPLGLYGIHDAVAT